MRFTATALSAIGLHHLANAQVPSPPYPYGSASSLAAPTGGSSGLPACPVQTVTVADTTVTETTTLTEVVTSTQHDANTMITSTRTSTSTITNTVTVTSSGAPYPMGSGTGVPHRSGSGVPYPSGSGVPYPSGSISISKVGAGTGAPYPISTSGVAVDPVGGSTNSSSSCTTSITLTRSSSKPSGPIGTVSSSSNVSYSGRPAPYPLPSGSGSLPYPNGTGIYPVGTATGTAVSPTGTAHAMPACWEQCFDTSNATKPELCGNGKVDTCIKQQCSAVDAATYNVWLGKYCPATPSVSLSPAYSSVIDAVDAEYAPSALTSVIPSASVAPVVESVYSQIEDALPSSAVPSATAVPELPSSPDADEGETPGAPGKGWSLKEIIEWLAEIIARLKGAEEKGKRNHARDLGLKLE